MTEVSPNAQALCVGLFALGEDSEIAFPVPSRLTTEAIDALDELVQAGVILSNSRVPNGIQYFGTERSKRIGFRRIGTSFPILYSDPKPFFLIGRYDACHAWAFAHGLSPIDWRHVDQKEQLYGLDADRVRARTVGIHYDIDAYRTAIALGIVR